MSEDWRENNRFGQFTIAPDHLQFREKTPKEAKEYDLLKKETDKSLPWLTGEGLSNMKPV